MGPAAPRGGRLRLHSLDRQHRGWYGVSYIAVAHLVDTDGEKPVFTFTDAVLREAEPIDAAARMHLAHKMDRLDRACAAAVRTALR